MQLPILITVHEEGHATALIITGEGTATIQFKDGSKATLCAGYFGDLIIQALKNAPGELVKVTEATTENHQLK